MKIEFTITNNTVELLANTDTGDNSLYVNDTLIPESSWVGSGTYTVDGISIQQIPANSGNVYCQKIDDTHYKLVSKIAASITAAEVSYNNTTSGATALQVQAALDELFAEKVDKVTGKQLTTEDFTTALLNKLNGIEANANNYSLPLAASGTRGGIQVGYTKDGMKYPVSLSSEKAYVEVTDLGLPSSASAVSGADAFSKINQLNSNLSGTYYVYGRPFLCNSGNYGMTCCIPIPAGARNNFSYSITGLEISSQYSTITLTPTANERIIVSQQLLIMTTALTNYFNSTRPTFTSFSDLCSRNASIVATIKVTSN